MKMISKNWSKIKIFEKKNQRNSKCCQTEEIKDHIFFQRYIQEQNWKRKYSTENDREDLTSKIENTLENKTSEIHSDKEDSRTIEQNDLKITTIKHTTKIKSTYLKKTKIE